MRTFCLANAAVDEVILHVDFQPESSQHGSLWFTTQYRFHNSASQGDLRHVRATYRAVPRRGTE